MPDCLAVDWSLALVESREGNLLTLAYPER